MADRVLSAFDAEIADLEAEAATKAAKLARLRTLRAQYLSAEGASVRLPQPQQRPPRVRHAGTPHPFRRPRSPETVAILQRVRRILEEANRPMGTTELLNTLISQGIKVPGSNPLNNLSAMLSKSEDFQTQGRGTGWSVTGKEVDTKSTRPELFPAHQQP